MPKKTANARGNAQRNRAKLQKNVQLVRPNAAAPRNQRESELREEVEETPTATTLVAEVEEESSEQVEPSPPPSRRRRARASAEAPAPPAVDASAVPDIPDPTTPRSASERMAARRQQQAAQKTQQRQAPTLVTVEHYSYVRRDLIFIAILAIIMFSALIILHFVPAIGG